MAELTTGVNLKLSMEELKALNDMLKFHNENPFCSDIADSAKDALNGIYFSINDTVVFKQ